jgi:N-acetylglucosaminyldiphosphoundecaprenol N-acetyl-beta-D-mannosaminyltransferase
MIGTAAATEVRRIAPVLGVPIDVLSWDTAVARIAHWARERQSRIISICNVHVVVTAIQDAAFRRVIEDADMATADGMPVAWMLRRLGFAGQQRINGPDLMWKYCAHAAANGEAIFLYGSTPETLAILRTRLLAAFPALTIAGMIAPPFRPLTEAEDAEIVDTINRSGAGTVWVGLGCPKQEHWMAAHRGRINAVMVGVGAAFDWHAGTVKRAPLWMQHNGLEWLHRVASEPRRLWKRYLVTNMLFVIGAALQLAGRR